MIYIVTSGEYSDYGIEAVFDSEALAEEFIKLFCDSSNARVEEYELNPYTKEIREGISFYIVKMNKDGNVDGIYKETPSVDKAEGIWYFYGYDSCMAYRIMAKSEEQAIKVVNEKRTQMIANNTWGRK